MVARNADQIAVAMHAQIKEHLARDFGNITLWHTDAATLLRRYGEMKGEIETLRLQQQTDRETIASLTGSRTPQAASPVPGTTT